MRHPTFPTLCMVALSLAAGCGARDEARPDVERAVTDVDVIDESNLSDIMLTVADPNEAVVYFRKAAAASPERTDLQRGLARSLIRAGQPAQAAPIFARLVAVPGAAPADRIDLADALIRAGEWAGAEAAMAALPPEIETYRRYRIDAMIADANLRWDEADVFYEAALGRTTTPAGLLNNWGYSKLTRGDHGEAEKLFTQALGHDPTLFTAKNNMVLARGAQRNYELPVVQMDQTERAQLLHTMALAAIKQGDVATGKTLLGEAVETNPRHFEAAARALEALETGPAG